MASFSPNLSGGISFEQPVQTPSALGTVAGLAQSFASSFGDAPQPSASDRKSVALKPLTTRLADIENSNMSELQKAKERRKVLRGGLVSFPEYSSDIKSIGVQFGETPEVEVQDPLDVQAEAMNTFFVTPQGQVADMTARRKAMGEDGVFNEEKYLNLREQAFAEYQTTQARIDGIEQKRELSDQVWETFKPQAESLIFGVTDDIIDLTEEIRINGSVEVPEELAQIAGVPSGKITQENFVLYLTRYRQTLKRQIRNQALATSGWDSNQLNPASDEWYNSVLQPVDDMIEVAKKDFGSISNVRSTLTDQASIRARRTLEERSPRLAENIDLLNLIPQELQVPFFNKLHQEGISEEISKAFIYSYSADVAPAEIEDDVKRMSSRDAEDNLKVSKEVLGSGQAKDVNLKNSFTSFFSSRNRVVEGDVYLSDQAWDNIVSKNGKGLAQAFANDPQFAENSSIYLLSDLNMTMNAVKSSGSRFDWASLGLDDNGSLVVNIDRNNQSFQDEFPEGATDDELQAFKDELLNSPRAKLLRKKINTLRGMGATGQSILSSFALEQGGGDTQLQGSEGEDTIQDTTYMMPQEVQEDTEFLQTVSNMAAKYNADPSIFLRAMQFETGGTFDPAQRNAAGSGATGLIQFMPSTAKELGTTTEELAQMSRTEQMRYVEKYFDSKLSGVTNPTFSDVYMAILWPKAVGEPDDYVLFKEGSKAYEMNAGLDTNGSGTVTKGEAAAKAFGRTSGAVVAMPAPGQTVEPVRPRERPAGIEPIASNQQTQGGDTSVGTQRATQEGSEGAQGTTTAETTRGSPEAAQRVWETLANQTRQMLIRLFGNEEAVIQAIKDKELSPEDLT